MTETEKNEIILRAAIEIGSEYVYVIRNGTLGTTLYVHVDKPELAREARKKTPMVFEGLRTIVLNKSHNVDSRDN